MARNFSLFLMMLGAVSLLAGCGSREESDAKLARACEAGVKVILAKETYDRQLDRVKKKTFAADEETGGRRVELAAVSKNKEYGYEQEESFVCKFDESYAPGFASWKAALINIKVGEDLYGSEGGEIFGDVQDQMNLTAAVESALK
jgi:hypothetical protein